VLTAFAGGSVFGERWGDGPPQVIWLHGWGRSSGDFRSAAATLLEKGVSSVALDLPGFGASPHPAEPCGARGYALVIAPVISEITEGQPYLLVGHSFGGRIAVVLASSAPENLRGVVLTGAPLIRQPSTSSRSPLAYRAIRQLARWRILSAARLEVARKKYGSADYAAAVGVMRDVLVTTVNESYEAELQKMRVPAVFVWGSRDRDVPLTVAEQAVKVMSTHTELRVEDGCGHLVPLERPAALVDAVVSLL
jgi:pimeloyl-ACP methyl ester carboxylesterase